MPTITFNWKMYTAVDSTPYSVNPGTGWIAAPWISVVQWRDATGGLITDAMGVYIIENNPGPPIYAGQALSLRDRFDGRSSALHELHVTSAMLATWTVWATSVVISPQNYKYKLDWAEYWLIRFLFVRDHKGANAPPRLQNRMILSSFDAPADGLVIQFNPMTTPAYLNDPTSPGYANPNPSLVTYTYGANAPVMP